MIQKIYNCELDGTYRMRYQVSAWMAMGSNTVNIRLKDAYGWAQSHQELPAVDTERLSDYAHLGIKTMDDLIEHLYYVVKA